MDESDGKDNSQQLLDETHCGPAFALDPFRALPKALHGLRSVRSRTLLWSIPILIVVVFSATVADGTLGSAHDFQLPQDIMRAFGIGHPPSSSASFPFLRDLPSWVLFSLLICTILTVHRQWRLFLTAVDDLVKNGVLTLRAEPQFSEMQQRLWCKRLSRIDGASGFSLGAMVRRMNRALDIVSKATAMILAVSVGLTLLVVESEKRIGLFSVLSPRTDSKKTKLAFSRNVYEHWWASSHHVTGLVVYVALISIGLYVIIIQNIVGMCAVYIAGSVSAFFNTSVDWFDQDGSYGWRRLGEIYRTVKWSLGLHGIAIAVLLIAVGFSVWRWAFLLFGMWLFALPVYLGVPWLVFRRVEREAQEGALRLVATETLNNGTTDGVQEPPARRRLVLASQVVPFIRQAPIHPLRLSRFGSYAFFVAVIVPTILAGLEIFLPGKIGRLR